MFKLLCVIELLEKFYLIFCSKRKCGRLREIWFKLFFMQLWVNKVKEDKCFCVKVNILEREKITKLWFKDRVNILFK